MPSRRPPRWDASTSDEDLVAWVQHGEREAFGLLYDRYLAPVYRYCHRLLGEPEAAEDANSLVFTKALAALSTYHACSFRGWLFTIAHNVITDALRARRAEWPLEIVMNLADPRPSLEEIVIVAAERQSVLDLLPHLSDDQRHVVALRLSGLTAAEIAEVLGRPRNAIDGIHHRAVIRLREILTGSVEPTLVNRRES